MHTGTKEDTRCVLLGGGRQPPTNLSVSLPSPLQRPPPLPNPPVPVRDDHAALSAHRPPRGCLSPSLSPGPPVPVRDDHAALSAALEVTHLAERHHLKGRNESKAETEIGWEARRGGS